ncbi:MAG TPA: NUDIX domain-containing protein [Ignavibacteria bacterium]|nr:NUDIX domain-containing protein [Ignavibacteria bacterium]
MIESEDIRVSAKAIIITDNKLLTAKKEDENGFFYTIPGGGQNHSESLEQALVRECREEISVEVKMKRLLFIRDYIGANHEFPEHAARRVHQLDIMFEADIISGTPQNGHEPDNGQISVEWLPLEEIENFRLYPKALIKHLKYFGEIKEAVYLGDVN